MVNDVAPSAHQADRAGSGARSPEIRASRTFARGAMARLPAVAIEHGTERCDPPTGLSF
jgi:hypothetical protein